MSSMNYIKGTLIALTDKIRSYDRTVLIGIGTGCVFSVLGLIQLLLIVFAPSARTFDHISLVIVDAVIAAVCFAYPLYRNSMKSNSGNNYRSKKTNTNTNTNRTANNSSKFRSYRNSNHSKY